MQDTVAQTLRAKPLLAQRARSESEIRGTTSQEQRDNCRVRQDTNVEIKLDGVFFHHVYRPKKLATKRRRGTKLRH